MCISCFLLDYVVHMSVEFYCFLDIVSQVLDGLLSKYEASSHGPEKWRKLTIFLQQRFYIIVIFINV